MTEIKEGKLSMSFDNSVWEVQKYDDCETFKKHIGKTENLKAVDIVGIHNKTTIYFFEMKDYNGSEATNLNKWNYNINNLTNDLSQKVKDTILGIFSTQRNELAKDEYWESIISIFNNNNDFKIIFWIDGDLLNYSKKFRLSQISLNLKKKLRCLNSSIIVTNSEKAKFEDITHKYE